VKVLREPARADRFVLRVRGPVGDVVGDLREQVSDVVQQRGDHQRLARLGQPGKVRRLQACSVIDTHSPKYAPAPRAALDREDLVGDSHVPASAAASLAPQQRRSL